jgi:hypothetical protein
MTTEAAKAKLSEKSFLKFDPAYSNSEKLNFDAVDLEINEVPIFSVWVDWYQNEIRSVEFHTKITEDINIAFQRLVKLREFFSAQGKKISLDRLANINKGGDLEQSGPVVTFSGSPCDIDIYSTFNKGKPLQVIRYDVNSVRGKKAADRMREREAANKKSADLLK